ncbi:MAG: response regulator transcription factor [Melioribacteraceae bacterium]
MISVAIIEDIRDIREPLFEFLSNQEEIVCNLAEESVEDFFANYDKEISPDVILLDIGLPGISGLAAIKIIKEKIPEVNIIMFTVQEEYDNIFNALKSGASGYMLKSEPLAVIKAAILDVHVGGAPMSSQIARKVINYFSQESITLKDNLLTSKETEITNYVVDGLNYKMIAANLDVSVNTIKFHIKNIYTKLHINSQAELVAKSIRGEI